ncbi:hypothetical protein [Streptacidiphilus sp. PAMC 29251]
MRLVTAMGGPAAGLSRTSTGRTSTDRSGVVIGPAAGLAGLIGLSLLLLLLLRARRS